MPPKQTSRPPPAPQTVEYVPIDEFGSGPTAKWREKGASDGSTSAAKVALKPRSATAGETVAAKLPVWPTSSDARDVSSSA